MKPSANIARGMTGNDRQKTTKGDKMKYIILSGNPVEGYEFYGPFDTQESALKYADNNLDYGREWCFANLIAPKGE
jgi:hypothetical protein